MPENLRLLFDFSNSTVHVYKTHEIDNWKKVMLYYKRNWVLATNSEFIIPISLETNVVNLWYFKLILFDLAEFIVGNIYGLRHWNPKILGLEKQSLWQRLNSFVIHIVISWKFFLFHFHKKKYVSKIHFFWNWKFSYHLYDFFFFGNIIESNILQKCHSYTVPLPIPRREYKIRLIDR